MKCRELMSNLSKQNPAVYAGSINAIMIEITTNSATATAIGMPTSQLYLRQIQGGCCFPSLLFSWRQFSRVKGIVSP